MYKKMINQRFIKFVLVGSLNTGSSYLMYLFFLFFLPYNLAYSVSFVASIIISYFLNTYWVFKHPWRWKKLAQFPLAYIVQYLVGLLLLNLLVDYFGMNEKIAPLLIIIFLVPLSYIIIKKIIHGSDSD